MMEYRVSPYILRPLEQGDAAEVLRARLESLDELKRWLPVGHLPLTLEGQRERLRVGPDRRFGLFERDRLLASGSLHRRVPLNARGLEIGFWVRSCAQGRGLATLVARLLVAHAVEDLGCDRVQIAHSPDNAASRRVIEKCGFQFEGRVRNALSLESVARGVCRDLLSYSLLPDEARAFPWYWDARASRVGGRR